MLVNETCFNASYVFSDADSAAASVCAGATAVVGTVLNAVTVIALLNYSKTRCERELINFQSQNIVQNLVFFSKVSRNDSVRGFPCHLRPQLLGHHAPHSRAQVLLKVSYFL